MNTIKAALSVFCNMAAKQQLAIGKVSMVQVSAIVIQVKVATDAMNAALGTEAAYYWHTDDPNTPPTLVPNN